MSKLKEIIIKSGLKQCFIATKIGVTDNTMSSYISGRRKPRIDRAKKLAEILNCEIEDIFFDINNH